MLQSSSSDDDDNFASISKIQETKILANATSEIKSVGYDLSTSTPLMDDTVRELLAGVIGRKGRQDYGADAESAVGF